MRFLRSGEEGLPAALGAWSPLSAIGFDAAHSKTQLFQLRNNATIFVHLHSTVYIVYNNTTDGLYNHIRHSSLTSPVSVIDIIDIAKELLIDIDKGKSIDSTTLVTW